MNISTYITRYICVLSALKIQYELLRDGIIKNTREEIVTIIKEEIKTKPEVIHAEANAIAKLARTTESGLDASMFITYAPCMECAKLIYGAGINKVFYKYTYRENTGIEFLKKCNIEVEQV